MAEKKSLVANEITVSYVSNTDLYTNIITRRLKDCNWHIPAIRLSGNQTFNV